MTSKRQPASGVLVALVGAFVVATLAGCMSIKPGYRLMPAPEALPLAAATAPAVSTVR
jgi:hypothetical protein